MFPFGAGLKNELQTESRYMEFQMNEIIFLISVTLVERELLHSISTVSSDQFFKKIIFTTFTIATF